MLFMDILFKHFVAMIKAAVAYLIPDIPANIFVQLQRQRFLARQARISDITSAVSARNDLENGQDSTKKRYVVNLYSFHL